MSARGDSSTTTSAHPVEGSSQALDIKMREIADRSPADLAAFHRLADFVLARLRRERQSITQSR